MIFRDKLKDTFYVKIKSLIIVSLFVLILLPIVSFAQFNSVDIAKTYIISENVVISGDIISFDRTTQQFQLSRERGDKTLFGVATQEPLLVLETDPQGVPIVRTGEVRVNITTKNGAISAGDYITSSSIPGKGQRAEDTDTYIIGIALESFPGDSELASSVDGDGVLSGIIRVLLSVGTQEQAAEVLSGVSVDSTGITEATLLNVVQYLLAAFIAVSSIYIAFKNFGPNIKNGIVSIGRNPLAKSSIQSMVILNVVLILLISVGGLFVSIAILLLPI